MEEMKINNKLFKKNLFKKTKLKRIYNYYGLVEQTGSIFVECDKCSCFTTSVYSDILIRDKHFNIVKNGEKGFIQLFSLLPTSYPGHSILTEDIGEIVSENNCVCQNRGKRFLVHGRALQSETRGCSDT
jgi:phenylacetate-coenzyme A ligase PaaK-like adenylate-forming protein